MGGPNSSEESAYLHQLKDQVQRLGIDHRIHFLGFRSDIPSIMKGLDLLVLPSLIEGFGRVLIEAMAMAKPVVATQVGGPEEVVVNYETGFIVPPGDLEALYKSMASLTEKPDMARVMGIKGRERVEKHFSIMASVKKFEDVLATL